MARRQQRGVYYPSEQLRIATAGVLEAAADGSFDLASLPSIEAITADTDIRGFLQSRVPAELTRAALRQDHAAILCEIMAGLVGGGIAAPAGADREFFEKHLAPWIRRFFSIWSTLNQLTFTLAWAR